MYARNRTNVNTGYKTVLETDGDVLVMGPRRDKQSTRLLATNDLPVLCIQISERRRPVTLSGSLLRDVLLFVLKFI
jgi:hypothetical protein